MKASIRWSGGVSFAGCGPSGFEIPIDGAPEAGGQGKGSRPMEVVLIGMGGCTAFDVMHILRKQRQDVTDCIAEMDAERAPTDPKGPVSSRTRRRLISCSRAMVFPRSRRHGRS